MAQAGTVEASDTVSVSQAVTLHTREAAANYSIAESASNLSNASGASNIAIGDARHVTATTVANAFQAEAILTRAGGDADKVTYDVADTHANLMANVPALTPRIILRSTGTATSPWRKQHRLSL